jgi:hypothetical protein
MVLSGKAIPEARMRWFTDWLKERRARGEWWFAEWSAWLKARFARGEINQDLDI